MPEDLPTIEEVVARRESDNANQGSKVIFKVRNLYGLSHSSIKLPLNEEEFVESGQVALTGDPEADEICNVGIIDYESGELKVRYGAQAVFPGLHQLVVDERLSPSLLDPVRLTATDQCDVAPDFSGWHAYGYLDFLPGSVWAGATGG